MPVVEANRARIFVEDTGAPAGRPDAPAIVFGHGLLFSGRMFAAQVERLRDRYRCVTIDWRGQGRSPAADGGYDMDTLTEDAVAVIEALGVGPVHFVGLSMGGFVGMRLGARRPDLIRSLVLLDTSAGPEDPEKVSQYRLLATVYGVVGLSPVRGRVEPIMFGPTFLASSAARRDTDAWVADVKACRRSGVKQAIRGVTDREPVLAELDRITAPTLVAVGDEDVATPPAKAEVIAGAIAGARLEIVTGSGHSSTIEQPERLADLIEDFVDAH
ncbi:alpha/beta fold hydrolase [Aeromicrobium chenweiae]|uniref:Alpha/beta hydrolase n=1 Tax=Aeromicrobium chenweiae TaxID=2079793 RepID=A0A2S0WIH7_9ACTN|nr:alpha/beta fold hydrolase [Aeromicrobium chenweiae]AWB91092.1 alpha/beta hydrolase [Aeromicrobium chenweiae]TGN31995.1 alpha/beta fold hydrolase [Aeromicrobium chenweiae]